MPLWLVIGVWTVYAMALLGIYLDDGRDIFHVLFAMCAAASCFFATRDYLRQRQE